MSDPPVILLKGSDEILIRQAALDLLEDLVGDGDRALLLDEFDAERYERDGVASLDALVDAARTPAFLTDRRIVVGRDLGSFTTKVAVAPLVAYLGDPSPTTVLVLAWEKASRGASVPKSLVEAIKEAGGRIVDTAVSDRGKARDVWIREQIDASAVDLDASARRLLTDTLATESSRLPGVLAVLASTFAAGESLGADDIAPYLGQRGDVQPWSLTDAIDAGDTALALSHLERMMGSGGRHPLQVMAVLTNHVMRMVRLDGVAVSSAEEAARLLGMKGSSFPAKKALEQGRRLGSARLADFVDLLARADLDLRGARAWPPELVIEVLVARLAGRTPSRRSGARG